MSRSSACPVAARASRSAVAGATITSSACLPTATCATWSTSSKTSVVTGWPDRASQVARPTNSSAARVGTTLYTAPYDAFDPRYGPGSRAAHLDAGAVEVGGLLASLRRDVDDLADLAAAQALGLGPRTAAVVAGLAMR